MGSRFSWSCRAAVTVAMAILFPTIGLAQDLSFGAELGASSRYVWRGLVLDDGWAARPSAWVSARGLTLEAWANVPAGTGAERLTETDLVVSYDAEWQGLGITPSASAYFYPGEEDGPTAELGLGLVYPLGPFELSSNHTMDLVAVRGAYAGDLGLSVEQEVVPDLVGLELSGSLGWGSPRFHEANYGVAKAAFNAVAVEAAVVARPVSFGYIRPCVCYTTVADPELARTLVDGESPRSNVAVGLGIGVEF